MHTAYDWISVLLFAGLLTRFLADSVAQEPAGMSIWQYLVPSAGCAAANWFGNRGWHVVAIPLLVLVGGYIYHILSRRVPPRA